MKFSSQILLILASALAARCMVVCPDGVKSNCYPQVFQPSNQWQVVREGQHIPAGLHVRLNFETGEQEARLLQPDDSDEGSELALIDNSHSKTSLQEDVPSYGGDRLPSRGKFSKKPRASDSELVDYDSSVAEVLDFRKGADITRLGKAIDTLVELSHDIDFGHQLSSHPELFSVMSNIAETVSENESLAEKIYRVIGASLRNNPKAVKSFIQNHQPKLIPQLYRVLERGHLSEVVQKRILGVIHALSLDETYGLSNFNLADAKNAQGLNSLITVFPKLAKSAKERSVLILEDLNMVPESSASGAVDADEAFSAFLQGLLHSQQSNSEQQFQTIFRSLVELHEGGRLPVKREFLQWLSKEVEERRTGIKKRDLTYSNTDSAFDSYLSSARHRVFGNPNAARKAGEEL